MIQYAVFVILKKSLLVPTGQVGITLNCDWFEPEDAIVDSDVAAAERGLQFFIGWFAHAIFVDGDYPDTMKSYIQQWSTQEGRNSSRLPEFTDQDKKKIAGRFVSLVLSYIVLFVT